MICFERSTAARGWTSRERARRLGKRPSEILPAMHDLQRRRLVRLRSGRWSATPEGLRAAAAAAAAAAVADDGRRTENDGRSADALRWSWNFSPDGPAAYRACESIGGFRTVNAAATRRAVGRVSSR